MSSYRVRVEAATVWSSPDAPRPVDAPAVADEPDPTAWIAAMGSDGRLGLYGRTETQLLLGEPVTVVEEGTAGWIRVVAPWQPSPKDARGYPGWVRRSHLRSVDAPDPGQGPSAALGADPPAICEWARRFLGLRYLWGGLSRHGLDCSGLVHLSYREAGVVIPRDAHAQYAAAAAVALGEEQPGDLYFFARDDGWVFHVGIVSGTLRILHASEGADAIEEVSLTGQRLDTLVAAGRLLPPTTDPVPRP